MKQVVLSEHGLLTTVAYQLGSRQPACYALEVCACFLFLVCFVWHGDSIIRASDLRFIGRGFESCLGTIVQWAYTSYLHLCASVTLLIERSRVQVSAGHYGVKTLGKFLTPVVSP